MSNFITNVVQNVFSSFVNAIKNITIDHHYIHQGKKYLYLIDAQTISTGSTYAVSFITPSVASGKQIHWRPPKASCSADKLKISLFEGDAYTGGSDGSSSVYNRNRSSSNETAMQAFVYGSSHVNGDKIDQDYIGGGTGVGGTSSSGNSPDSEELVLKVNTKYTLLHSNGSSGDNIVNVKLSWYEEDVL